MGLRNIRGRHVARIAAAGAAAAVVVGMAAPALAQDEETNDGGFGTDAETFDAEDAPDPLPEDDSTLQDPVQLTAGEDQVIEAPYGGVGELRPTFVSELANATAVQLAIQTQGLVSVDASAYANCEVDAEDPTITWCTFDGFISAGGFTLAEPLSLVVDPLAEAPSDAYVYYAAWATPVDVAPMDAPEGDILELEGAEVTPKEGDDAMTGMITGQITGDNPVDYSVTGSEVSGAAGEVVEATVTIDNVGTAQRMDLLVDDETEESISTMPVAVFSVPQGTSVTGVPEGCYGWVPVQERIRGPGWVPEGENGNQPGLDAYGCFAQDEDLLSTGAGLLPGDARTYTFELTIDTVQEATEDVSLVTLWAAGPSTSIDEALANDGGMELDGNADNDVDQLAVNADSGAGKLPVTGTSLTLSIAVASAALLGGAVLFVLVRRRRAAATW